ncbi:glycoside hydrolase family protein [Mucilaginibacter sp. PAMB04168]|uniref:glycoside hydrolase family protein n=1 Tax=Mucilaginibacter sp. PAMB04168 TaxID=3138567 RepID=UPI0031F68387
MQRRKFIQGLGLTSAALAFTPDFVFAEDGKESDFAKHLVPVGRRLEMEGYYVWCNSPIEGPDGKIHIFFSRWVATKKMGGWINGSEICHAVADSPEGEFKFVDVVLAPRGPGHWDATTCHNPSIKFVDGQYCLFFMGNSNGKTNTKRIGLATAPTLNGPWKRPDQPLLEAGPAGAWDDHCTTNPAFIKQTNGEYWLYYKSWNTAEYENSKDPLVRGNRKYGLAISRKLEGPYIKYEHNPVIDFSSRPNNAQLEDAFVWMDKGRINMLARDMGIFNHEYGLLMQSKNGKKWNEPQVAYYDAAHYHIVQPSPPSYLKKYGRFERPQLLFQNGKPTYLFTTSQGGKYMTASSFLFKIV